MVSLLFNCMSPVRLRADRLVSLLADEVISLETWMQLPPGNIVLAILHGR